VTGAGSKAVPQASASVSVRVDVPSSPEMADPKAVKVRLNSSAKCLRTSVSRFRTAATELVVGIISRSPGDVRGRRTFA